MRAEQRAAEEVASTTTKRTSTLTRSPRDLPAQSYEYTKNKRRSGRPCKPTDNAISVVEILQPMLSKPFSEKYWNSLLELDRLSRDIAFIANLQKSKVEFVCFDMPDANTLTIGMMALLAQYDRELISERTQADLQAAKARNVKLGNPTLHLVRNTDTTVANETRRNRAAERNAQLRDLIAEIETDAAVSMSMAEIAHAFNTAGYKTARGKLFTKTQVHRIKAA